ncbi:PTS transporter subunit EIIB [Dorea amylophila]|uniref:PTS transporter subunit EIIB n=1 Tax=Dorea amylophila TaxID=2981789 RepID=UPI0022E06D22|nr:PTS transporter subunit EIIB [Dorea amylophila]
MRLVGGKENVVSAAHCATRLRLVLKDESKADVDGILKTELVKGQFSTGGQFQIIIGSGTVDEVYKYFIQYAAMFGSAVGCAYVTLTNVQNISPGAAGIIGFVCIKSGGMLNYMIGILISLVVGFAVTMALSKHPKFKEV